MLARLVVLLLLAPLALVAGCSSHKPASSSGAVDVAPGKAAALVLPDGAKVEVPAAAVSGSARLSGTVVGSPPPAPRSTTSSTGAATGSR